jgi:hypothetical protein
MGRQCGVFEKAGSVSRSVSDHHGAYRCIRTNQGRDRIEVPDAPRPAETRRQAMADPVPEPASGPGRRVLALGRGR